MRVPPGWLGTIARNHRTVVLFPVQSTMNLSFVVSTADSASPGESQLRNLVALTKRGLSLGLEIRQK